ncbi:MAG: SagB/ThcOx family dehydrogenase [Dehalococcoidia bacterium]|nr:SagB/ThcOx family dehydrogenase [Dehalococcoidia bacterium]
MELPEPCTTGATSLEEALSLRRSVRQYGNAPLTLQTLSQLLWAAQGSTGTGQFRTAPSAGATYPLQTYVVVGAVEGMDPGLYHYESGSHSLSLVKEGDLREALSEVSLKQTSIVQAAISVVFAAIYEKTTGTYGDRGQMYVHMDVGHAAQNVLLQATALGLASVPVAAFKTRTVASLLELSEGQVPLYIVPVGAPRSV